MAGSALIHIFAGFGRMGSTCAVFAIIKRLRVANLTDPIPRICIANIGTVTVFGGYSENAIS
jgi:hypothetical protein